MDSEATTRGPRVPLWVGLLGMVAALGVAALILSRVSGPLYGLVFRSGVPVPDGAVEIEHVRPDKGTAYRIYRTEQAGRQVAAFYEAAGGTCVYSVAPANPDLADSAQPDQARSVARCRGRPDNAARGSGWEVFIAEGYDPDEGPTIFRVYEY